MSIPSTQYGYQFDRRSCSLKLNENMLVRKPRPEEVLVKVEGAGLCHSDLHVLYDGLDCGDGYVMGHEIAGKIVAKGDDVGYLEVGERVACFGPNACGVCTHCRTGNDNDCTNSLAAGWLGLGIDGGYQQYTLVKRPRNLIKIPEGVESTHAASITDAVLTPYHAIKMAHLTPASKVLCIGAGGLGLNSIQIMKTFGANITVLDKKETALEIAESLGADEVYTELPHTIKEASFDVCIDIVAVQSTFNLCQKYVKSKGIIMPLGLGETELKFDLYDLNLREISILGSFWGTSNDLIECFELVKQGKVQPHVFTAPLKELPSYIEKLRRGEYEGRLVLIP